MKAIVTIKLPKDPKHNSHNKKLGTCKIYPFNYCTDKTGEHHSILIEIPDEIFVHCDIFIKLAVIKEKVLNLYGRKTHITRIEIC